MTATAAPTTGGTDLIVRAYAAELVRSTAGDGRTVEGIAVPFDVVQRIPFEGIDEVFRRGAFKNATKDPARVKTFTQHGHRWGELPIGRADRLVEEADGLHVELRLARSAEGDRALGLVEDGVLDQLSIGFRPMRDKTGEPNPKDGFRLVERQLVHLREVSLVWEAAYGTAAPITGTRGEATAALDRWAAIRAGLDLPR